MDYWKQNMNIQNFEKLLLGFLLFTCTMIGCYKYMKVGDISANWTNVIFIIGGLFTARKAFSYWKSANYQEYNNQSNDIQGFNQQSNNIQNYNQQSNYNQGYIQQSNLKDEKVGDI